MDKQTKRVIVNVLKEIESKLKTEIDTLDELDEQVTNSDMDLLAKRMVEVKNLGIKMGLTQSAIYVNDKIIELLQSMRDED